MEKLKPGTLIQKVYDLIKNRKDAFSIWEIWQASGHQKKSAIQATLSKLETYGKVTNTGRKRIHDRNVIPELLYCRADVPIGKAIKGIEGLTPKIRLRGKERQLIYSRKKAAEKKTSKLNSQPKKEIKTMAKALLPSRELIRTELRDGEEIEIWYEGAVISKSQAFERGETRYFNPSAPCLRRHISQRLVTNSACVACQKLYAKNAKKKKDSKKRVAPVPQKYFKKPPLADLVRAVIASKADKGFTAVSLVDDVQAMGRKTDSRQVGQVVTRLVTSGEIEWKKGKMMGRYKLYIMTPFFWKKNERKKDLFLKINADHSLDIKKSVDKTEADIKIIANEEHKKVITHEQEASIPDFELTETPVAMIGRAIFEYMAELQTAQNRDAYLAKINDLNLSVTNMHQKYDDLLAKHQELSERNNDLQRKYYDKKAHLNAANVRIADLKRIIDKKSSGTFTMGEVASIKKVFDGDLNVPGGGNGS